MSAGTASGRGAFVWPPGGSDERTRADDATAVAARGERSAWGWIERDWLGVRAVSLRDRAVEAGWSPDGTGAYCPRCATSVGQFEADAAGCSVCREKRLAWNGAFRVGPYEGVLRDAVMELKFTAWRRVGREMGAMLGEAVAMGLRGRGVDPRLAVVVPVPTTFRRRMSRGVHHTLVLAREVASVCGGRVERGLSRKHRPTQTSLPRSERARNMVGVFRVRGPERLAELAASGRVFVVVDDVRTTGATMTAACRALRAGLPRGAEVFAGVVAVTPFEGR